jgi:sugar lactone lactonase YvrE
VTSCAFAGEELDHLIITTAIADMKPVELLKYPESGHTFVVKMGVSGIADHICTL